jgi:uncharacterized protein (DUF58 family)
MIPSRRFVILMLLPVGLALLTVFDDDVWMSMLAADAVLVLLAGVDAFAGRHRLVDVQRSVHRVFSVGRFNPVTLRLRSRATKTLTVEVTDDVFDEADVEGLPARLTLRAGAGAALTYRVRPLRRGAHMLGAHTIRYPTPFGLWSRQIRIDARDGVQVYPDVQAVRAYELLARQDRTHALVRATRRVGGDSEFERLREYTRDDEYRAIDWKATARRQKLISRQYQLERNQNLMLMLGAGRSMSTESAGLPLFDHALNASLLLAHVATRGGDRVGLMAFSDRVEAFIAPMGGRRAVQRIVQATYDVHPSLVESDHETAFTRLAGRLRQRTLLVVFTQVVDDVSADALHRFLRGLLPRHLPVVVLLRDPDLESMALVRERDADDMLYVRAAAAELLGWRDRLVRRLRHLGAHVLDVEPHELTVSLLNRYLEIKVRHLL